MDSENLALLVDAVRAGDIEAAQALLPVDPIVKRAREICGRHFGDPSRFLRGVHDAGQPMGAVTEALRTTQGTGASQILRAARAVCYEIWETPDYLSGRFDDTPNVERVQRVIEAALA